MPVTPDPGKRFGYVNPEESPFNSEEGFVGVSPEYQNYANETDKPLEGEETDEDEKDDEEDGEPETPNEPNQTPNASDGTNNNPAGDPF